MCSYKYYLTFFILSFHLVDSWDIALTSGDQIDFYNGAVKNSSEGERFNALTSMAYDAVYNMLLFVDKQTDSNASIYTYHLSNKKFEQLVSASHAYIEGIAFDPVKDLLFWTVNGEKSIFWSSVNLKSGTSDEPKKLPIALNNEIPRSIAVDSCRGYIYWADTNIMNAKIERARFDGTDRTTIVDTSIFMPVSVVVDQRTKRLYWIDDKEGIHFSIESSDLDGKNRRVIYEGTHHHPTTLTVSNDTIYWIDWGYKSVWKLPKNVKQPTEPSAFIEFTDKNKPFAIVANYRITEQTQGAAECGNLTEYLQKKSAFINVTSAPKEIDHDLFCLNGLKEDGKSSCKCKRGYSGRRCENSLCNNFCMNGDCVITPDGRPKCSRCKPGVTGERCEINVCRNYCLNGDCSFNVEDKEPKCACTIGFGGQRCELLLETNVKVLKSTVTSPESDVDSELVVATDCSNQGWDGLRDPIIMLLGVLCGLLCIACAILFIKILNLKKRPRIKRRIIVNKNVTPLTARPDQCEITIENCCNMNICETPCFEPRTTIRPNLLSGKPGKEEKTNLISNMENADDMY